MLVITDGVIGSAFYAALEKVSNALNTYVRKRKLHNWQMASREAGEKLYRLAALFSLAWDSTWKLFYAPQEVMKAILHLAARTLVLKMIP